MSLQGVLVLRSDSRLPTPRAEPEGTCSRSSFSHQLHASISGTTPRFFKNAEGRSCCGFSTQLTAGRGVTAPQIETERDERLDGSAGPSESGRWRGNPRRSGQGHKGQSEWRKRQKEGWCVNLLEAWSTHGLHHCFFLVLALVRCAPKIPQIEQCKIMKKSNKLKKSKV